MKKRISSLLLLVFVLSFAVFAFTSCGNKDNNEGTIVNGDKQVPVYQGMTITKSNSSTLSLTSTSYRSGGIMLLSANHENNGDNGNHNGHYKGDHADRNDTIDEENPYPDNNANENIEEEIKSSLSVVGSPDTIYYAEPNQDIYINIHIDNPDSFEIMSFTLNGKKYSSYMFEEGSDMETIVLKYNVGNAAGIVEYTIDAIKYIDGTEIKDVIIDGNKTVMAGVKTQNQVSANISNLNIGTNSLVFDANIKDNNALIEFSKGALKAVLYDGFSIVAEKDLVIGDNSVNFDGLKTNTLYQYAVIGYYDDLSGNGFGMNVLYKDAFYTDSVVLFDNITIGHENISFSFLWHEDHQNQSISALKLYKGNSFIKNVTADATSINELLSNTAYKLVAEYPNGNNTESICIEFTTLAKATPEISVVSPTKTQTSVGFEISETDSDNIGSVTKIELVHANGTIVADSLDQRTFANLLSNNAYTVKITYVYNLNDGTGDKTVTKELAITTLAKATPEISVVSPTKTDTTINAGYEFKDTDNVGSIDSVKIYKGSTFVSENQEKNIAFTGLEYYTEYRIVIAYSYNLNDGIGIQTKTFEVSYKTNPHLVFNSCKIINTSAVSEGETIYMQATLDNPSGALPSSVVVNGQIYNCTGSTTASKIYIEIVNNGQFEGGNTTLVIEEINMTLDGTTYTVKTNSNNSGTVFINGALSVESLQLVNANGEIVDYCMPGDEMYLLLTLKNKTGYTIDSVTINGSKITALTKIDDEHYRIDRALSNGWNYSSITSITYHNAYINKTLSVGNCTTNRVYKTNTSTVTEISTVEQLMNTKYNGGYYKLTADIDLSGIEWTNLGTFNGVFDGNGYKILNMSNVSTVIDKNVELGLFKNAYGVFSNVRIEDITIMITLNSSTSNTYGAYFGGFVSGSEFSDDIYATFVDCSISGDISINNTTGGTAFAGGLVGYEYPYPDYLYVDGCSVNVNISLKNGDKAIGTAAGIVGEFAWANLEMYVYNCTISGTITASNAQVINGATPWSTCIIDYKNNTCDIYLNGIRKTAIDDYYRYIE